MKFLILLILVLSGASYSQIQSVGYKNSDVQLSLFLKDSVYTINDTVEIKIELHNLVNKRLFIQAQQDTTVFIVKDVDKYISYSYGGTFDPEFEIMFRLKIIEPLQKNTLVIKCILNKIKPKESFNYYLFCVNFGYFRFTDAFKYLTEGNADMLKVNTNDINALINSHVSFINGFLPIKIIK